MMITEEENMNLGRMWDDTAGVEWGGYEYDKDTLSSYMKFPKNNNKNVFKKEYTQKPSKKNWLCLKIHAKN